MKRINLNSDFNLAGSGKYCNFGTGFCIVAGLLNPFSWAPCAAAAVYCAYNNV